MYWSTSARKTKRTAPISESNKGPGSAEGIASGRRVLQAQSVRNAKVHFTQARFRWINEPSGGGFLNSGLKRSSCSHGTESRRYAFVLSTGMISLLANRISQIESARGGDVRAFVADLIVILASLEPTVN
jgi:hypothetical protein